MADRYVPLDVTLIDPPSAAHRASIDPERLGQLADSMAAEGLHQPIGVRAKDARGRFEIIFGHRRFLAAKLLGWAEITARVFPRNFDPHVARASENLQRENLTPVEEAGVVKQFLDRGESIAATARHMRRSVGWVGTRIQLLAWPDDIKGAIQDGVLKLGVAELLAQIDHDEYRRELIAEAHRAGASVATVGVWCAHYAADRGRIIANTMTVQDIAQRREVFRIVTPCDYCGVDQAYELTRSFRLCSDCTSELLDAIRTANPQSQALKA